MTDQPTPEARTGPSRRRILLVGAVALLVLAFLAVASLLPDDQAPTPTAGSPSPAPTSTAPSPTTTQQAKPGAGQAARRTPGDPRAIGPADAPVVMVEWADFQCPFCARFSRTTRAELVSEYVDKGQLRIEWRDLPYIGIESTYAARGGRAAANQDRFWDYHDALYRAEHEVNSGQFTEAYLIRLADRLGLDVQRFTRDLRAAATEKAVHAEMDDGLDRGITTTPGFRIGDRTLLGAQPLATFEKAIDAELAKAR